MAHRRMRRIAVGLGVVTAFAIARAPVALAADPYDGFVRDRIRIENRFGEKLRAVLAFPTSGGVRAAGPLPVVLDYTPYCDEPGGDPRVAAGGGPRSAPAELILAGYVVAVVNWPGTCGSDGYTAAFDVNTRLSGYDAVEWLGTQGWSTGKVGMFGYSARGMSQLYTAELHPPHLATIVPISTYTDLYEDLIWRGGMQSSSELAQVDASIFADWWASNLSERIQDPDAARATIENFWFAGAFIAPSEFMTHPNKDSYWKEQWVRNPREIAVPILSMGNFNDSLARGNVNLYRDAIVPKMLVMGYFGHDLPGPGFDAIGLARRWFDRWLKGEANGIDGELADAPVKYYVREENAWRDAADWPIPGTAFADLHLAGGPPILGATGSLSLVPTGADGSDVYVYDPAQGHSNGQYGYFETARHDTYATSSEPELLRRNDPTDSGDQRQEIPGTVTYVSDALAEDTEVTGPTWMTLYASSTAEDTDWVVKLLDVFPYVSSAGPQPGYWNLVTNGWLKGTHRNGHEHPVPIPAGDVVRYDVELYPSSYLFRAGHRIGVQIASADAARTFPNPHPALNTVFRSASYPSRITLPIVP